MVGPGNPAQVLRDRYGDTAPTSARRKVLLNEATDSPEARRSGRPPGGTATVIQMRGITVGAAGAP